MNIFLYYPTKKHWFNWFPLSFRKIKMRMTRMVHISSDEVRQLRQCLQYIPVSENKNDVLLNALGKSKQDFSSDYIRLMVDEVEKLISFWHMREIELVPEGGTCKHDDRPIEIVKRFGIVPASYFSNPVISRIAQYKLKMVFEFWNTGLRLLEGEDLPFFEMGDSLYPAAEITL